jgi:hypothetical protein
MGERELNLLPDQVARGLFGHSVYQHLASDIRKKVTVQCYQQLEAFFGEEAPLGQLDQLSREKANLDDLTELVDRFLDDKDRTIVRLITETMQSKRFTEQRDRLADFLIGVVSAASERKALDTANMSLQDAVQLLASDLTDKARPRL